MLLFSISIPLKVRKILFLVRIKKDKLNVQNKHTFSISVKMFAQMKYFWIKKIRLKILLCAIMFLRLLLSGIDKLIAH